MSARPPLYSRHSKSPLASQSPFQNKELEKEMYASSDEYVESGDEEATDRKNTTTESLQQNGISPKATPQPTNSKRKDAMQQHILESARPQQSSQNLKIVLAIVVILSAMVCLYLLPQHKQKQCTFNKLREQQPVQSSDVWKALTINIENLLNKRTKSPNIYLFLYSSKADEQPLKQLIQAIALETSKCFDGQQPIEMTVKDFETNSGDDYGYPIEQYKKKLREGNVFLIGSLNDIPPNAARALHTICDTHSPIAVDVVIFLTLRTTHTITDGSPSNLAYQTLRELWKDVPDNELDALITRVIDQVLLLHS
ncbi:CG14103 [Drosophila busckii]|uniref:CG14103 n=1 Tax=Drosophila busckii TaxID=30019 RepID=A0A0M4EJH6_DROBS|nr:uncharacterized protein LOC108600387 [Drosophila busckii]ALC44176.1 CG14103 [Drosophila busckii]